MRAFPSVRLCLRVRSGVLASAATYCLLLVVALAAVHAVAFADQSSEPASAAAARLTAGGAHSCAVASGSDDLVCWGFSGDGQLGYGNTRTIGDDETPGSAGRVDLGSGRTPRAITAGFFHTCAVLDDGNVRCWGSGVGAQLGYGNSRNIGDDETPGSVPPLDLGSGQTAIAIDAGDIHNCAILAVSKSALCWGSGPDGRLGYPSGGAIGAPARVGPVDLGSGHSATAISAGGSHTCAVLDDGNVRCWGEAGVGQLGYGNRIRVGDDETPGSAGPVKLGVGRTATAISAGSAHTCALLDDGDVRCWGLAGSGRLGYGSTEDIGDDETPDTVAPVDLGTDRTAKAISAGGDHTCAILDNGSVRCWGSGGLGQLGYGRFEAVGDDELPGSVAPVDLGPGRTATAIVAADRHTCARLDDGNVRCWGSAGNGRLGLCSVGNIGDNEAPGSVGPIALAPPPDGGSGCVPRGGGSSIPPALGSAGPSAALGPSGATRSGLDPRESARLRAQQARARGLGRCRSKVAAHATTEIRRARRLTGSRRARAMRHMERHRSRSRRACYKRYGRVPGRVTNLKGQGNSATSVLLTFTAPGSDGARGPAAHTYLVKQSRRPIRSRRDFRLAQTLCNGRCRFACITRVGGQLTLTVTDLRPRTTYYYAIAALDNVSLRLGPRSKTKATTLREHAPHGGKPHAHSDPKSC